MSGERSRGAFSLSRQIRRRSDAASLPSRQNWDLLPVATGLHNVSKEAVFFDTFR
jgi:hypothetical protein